MGAGAGSETPTGVPNHHGRFLTKAWFTRLAQTSPFERCVQPLEVRGNSGETGCGRVAQVGDDVRVSVFCVRAARSHSICGVLRCRNRILARNRFNPPGQKCLREIEALPLGRKGVRFFLTVRLREFSQK